MILRGLNTCVLFLNKQIHPLACCREPGLFSQAGFRHSEHFTEPHTLPLFFPPSLFSFSLGNVEYEAEAKVRIAHEDKQLVFVRVENGVEKGAKGKRI